MALSHYLVAPYWYKDDPRLQDTQDDEGRDCLYPNNTNNLG